MTALGAGVIAYAATGPAFQTSTPRAGIHADAVGGQVAERRGPLDGRV